MTDPIYRVSRQAIQDLNDIEEYLSKQSPTAAVAVLDQLLTTFEFLASNQNAGEVRNDLLRGVRMFVPAKPASSYVIFYHSLPNGVEINHVVHSARDWEVTLLGRDA